MNPHSPTPEHFPMKTRPHRLVVLLAHFALLLAFATGAARAADKETFVLVHGATAGGWEWKRTGKFLTETTWQRAVARGWTIRTFTGGHVAQQEDPRGVATLIEESVNDRNKPASPK